MRATGKAMKEAIRFVLYRKFKSIMITLIVGFVGNKGFATNGIAKVIGLTIICAFAVCNVCADDTYYGNTIMNGYRITYRVYDDLGTPTAEICGRYGDPSQAGAYNGYGELSIYNNTFYNCPLPVGEMRIDDKISSWEVTRIGICAFCLCDELTAINIPESVVCIGDAAFYNCKSLSALTIPPAVTSIGNYAFAGCSELTSLTIPRNISKIGRGAFSGCNKIESFYIESGNSSYAGDSGLILSRDKKTLIAVPGAKTVIRIPDYVTTIEAGAFGSSNILSLNTGNGVTTIPAWEFSGSHLKSITFGRNVTNIETDAFAGCDDLDHVAVEDLASWCQINFGQSLNNYSRINNPLSIAHHLYQPNGVEITSLIIPSGVPYIGSRVFYGCSGLTSVTIPNSVTSIGVGAFCNCSGLINVAIPNSVTNIGSSAFRHCSGVASVVIPDSVISIGENAFAGCSTLVMVSLPGRFEGNMDSSVFANCSDDLQINYEYKWQEVMFDANGGRVDENMKRVLKGDTIGSMPMPTRENCVFLGWYTASVGGNVITESTRIWENTRCCARWQINRYEVTFDANGGTGGKSVTLDYGAALTPPSVTRMGYTFNGWLPEVDATVPASNVMYTAQWKINQYDVAFDANGGVGSVTNELDYASKIVAPEVTREGYTFVGWTPEVDVTVPASNVTYTAQWRVNKYNVAFDLQGGSTTGQTHLPVDGMVAYFPFNGDVNDASGHGNNLLSEYSVVYMNDRNSNADKAVMLHENTLYGERFEITNNWTIACWFKTGVGTNLEDEQKSGIQGWGAGIRYLLWPYLAVGNNGVNVFEHGDGFLPAVLKPEFATLLTD